MSTVLTFTIPALATFYAAYVLTSTAGPWNVFAAIRKYLPLGGLTSCFKCAIFWFALLFYFEYRTLPEAVYPFAVAGLALLVWRYTGASNV